PYVAGLAAYILSQSNSTLTGSELKAKMFEAATKGVVKNKGTGSPNLLMFNSPPKS
ncbi:hypothetical protein EV175_002120, partial [Coemansia sp. RSA 1933]